MSGCTIAIIALILACIGLIVRLLIEDQTTHNKDLRIAELERQIHRLRMGTNVR